MEQKEVVGALISMIMALVGVAVLFFSQGEKAGIEAMKTEIVEHGYGLYCPTDGNFAFKGACGNDTK